MGLYFGTDGLRGRVNEDLTQAVAYKVGNALATLEDGCTIIVGSDTRTSNTYLTLSLASGAMSGGANVIDIGVVPTAGIAFLTKELKADFGVVISASHNSAEYNGIKVFDRNGYKLGDKNEERIERCFIHEKVNNFPNIGSYRQDFNLIKLYKNFLINSSKNRLDGLKIVLDGAYGASHKIAPEVFRALGAEVVASNCQDLGLKINEKCGATYPQNLVKKMARYKADMGFAFDGDADRLVAVNELGEIMDGDVLICGMAKYLKSQGKLSGNCVVGTSHTNMAVEHDLKENGIDMIRTDIGDKYVLAKLLEKNLSIGGEQSGHIILTDYATTGDGILSAIVVANMIVSEKKKFSGLFGVKLYPQENRNIVVSDKFRVLSNVELLNLISKHNVDFAGKGRIMVRASGTEPKVRVMVESQDFAHNKLVADDIESLIVKINKQV